MSVTRRDRTGRPNRPPFVTERALLVILVAILLGVLAAVSPAWAIGLTVGLVALPVLSHITGHGPGGNG